MFKIKYKLLVIVNNSLRNEHAEVALGSSLLLFDESLLLKTETVRGGLR